MNKDVTVSQLKEAVFLTRIVASNFAQGLYGLPVSFVDNHDEVLEMLADFVDSVLDKSMVVGDELVVAPIREEKKDG